MLDNVLGRNSGLDNSQFMHLLTPARSVISNNQANITNVAEAADAVNEEREVVAEVAAPQEEEDQKKTARFS